MKTKHILTALALPAVFAACTAEDIVSENNSLQQDARAKVSKDFVLNTAGEVESRYAVVQEATGLKFNYEEGDLIGANLIDQYNPDPSIDVADWTILPYVAPSLPFKNLGGDDWKSDAELGVGNYLFTYPFNSKDNSRAAAAFELPRIQQYDSENPNGIIEDNNKAVGAVTLYEGQTDANVSLKNIYTYPKFVINFDNGEEVTKVNKVVLKKTGGFAYKGGFDHKAVVKAFQDAQDIRENEDLTKEEKDEAIAAHWAALQTSDFIIDGVNDQTYTGFDLSKYGKAETTPYLIIEMDEAVKANAVTDNKSVEVRLMMPSLANMFNQGLSMHVVTDNGTYQVEFSTISGETISKECDFVFKTDNVEKIKAALTRNASNTLRTKNLTLSEDKSEDGNLGNIVTTAEDWNNLVKNTKGATKVVPVSILSDKFVLTSDLDMPKDKVFFSINTKVAVEGKVTLSNINASDIIVKEGAVLTTSQTLTTGVVTVEEGAELVFAAAYDKDDNLVNYSGVDKIVNYGTVTVPAGVEAKVNFKDADSTVKLGNEKTGVLNVGSATASRAATDAIAHLEGINKGTINNYSVIEVPNPYWFINYSSYDAGYKLNEKTEEYDGVPTINNKGTFKSVGTATNYGLFINEGTLSSNYKTSSKFNNFGELKIAKACPTFIDTNAYGVIVLEDYKEAKLTINDAKDAADYAVKSGEGYRGTIRYTAAAKENEIDLSASMVNELIAEGNLKLTKTFTYTAEGAEKATVCELPELIINADSKLTIPAYTLDADNKAVYTAHVTKVTVKEEMTATVDGTINAVESFYLEKEAYLNIPVGATLAIDKITDITFGTESMLVVDGTLNNAELTGDKTTGVVSSWTGKPSNVEISKQGVVVGTKDTSVSDTEKEATKKAAIKDALKPLVEAWIKNTGDIKVNGIESWAGITANGIASSFKTEYQTITWVKAAANAFVTAYNAIDGVTDIELAGVEQVIKDNSTIVGAYNTDYATDKPSVLKTVYTAAYTKTNIAAAVKAALGNQWILDANDEPIVYVKEYDGQKIEDINGLMDAYKLKVDNLIETKGALGNAEWLSLIAWSEAKDATTSKALYPTNITSYDFVDSASYIEAYEGSNLHNDMKLWKDLSDKYSSTDYKDLKGYEFNAANLSIEKMTKFFMAINAYAKGDKVNVLFKNDPNVILVTDAKVVATAALKYYPAQLAGMANANIGVEATAAQTGNN